MIASKDSRNKIHYGDDNKISFAIHPNLMTLLAAAYAFKQPASKQEIPGFGVEQYGVRIVLNNPETGVKQAWRVLGEKQMTEDGMKDGVRITHFYSAYTEKDGREEIWIPMDALLQAEITIHHAQVIGFKGEE
jgi:hypothetical protein